MRTRTRLQLCLPLAVVTLMSSCGPAGFPQDIEGVISRPSFFPDRSVVVAAAPDGRTRLYVLDLRQPTLRQLTSGDDVDSSPAVSPDGTTVVFAKHVDNATNRWQLWRVTTSEPAAVPFLQNSLCDTAPTFLPDGSGIIFARAHKYRMTSMGGHRWDDWDLYVVKADGRGEQRLTQANYYSLSAPAISPDSRLVVFSNGDDVYLLELGERQQARQLTDGRNLTQDEHNVPISGDPSFSPDGNRIVFTSNRVSPENGPYAYEIFTMNLNGGDVRQVTTTGARNLVPVYHPDGSSILYVREDLEGTHAELWQIGTEGGDTRLVATLTSPQGSS